ncbi:MAG: hypothetical protein ACE5LL_00075 [Alphaproteobacteria bacterium]
MIRRSSALWIGLVGTMAVALFELKYEVQRLEDELAALDRDLLKSQGTIHVLRAEWSYLNRPDRLKDLAIRHLDLEPVTGAQIATLDALPLAPALSKAVLARRGEAQ